MLLRTLLGAGLIVTFVACGSSSEESTDTGTTPDVAADNAVTPDPAQTSDQAPAEAAETTGPTETEPFTATVIEFGSKPPKPVAGADVVLMDANGQPTTTATKSGADGKVTIAIPKGQPAGFKVSMAGYKDTYQFGLRPSPEGETLWIVTETLYNLAPAMAGLVLHKDASGKFDKGIVAGSIYWVNKEGKEEHVGCAKVETDQGGEARYFDPATGFPATLAKAPTTSKNLGYFLVANINPGKTKVTAKLDDAAGTVIGSVDIFSFADAICINNIYAQGDANPTPADCPR